MMRLIDADVLIAEICQDQCERKYCDCDYTCSEVAPVVNAPTIPAVPLDKLCEWLRDHAGRPIDCIGKLCGKCEFDDVGVGQEKCWENLIKKWMEGLDDHE